MEPHQRNRLSPAGIVDGLVDLTSGWTSNRAGRRRALRMLGWLAVVAAVAGGLVWLLA